MLAKSFKSLKNTFVPVASRAMASSNDQPKRVVLTGAAGQIGYATLFRIAR